MVSGFFSNLDIMFPNASSNPNAISNSKLKDFSSFLELVSTAGIIKAFNDDNQIIVNGITLTAFIFHFAHLSVVWIFSEVHGTSDVVIVPENIRDESILGKAVYTSFLTE